VGEIEVLPTSTRGSVVIVIGLFVKFVEFVGEDNESVRGDASATICSSLFGTIGVSEPFDKLSLHTPFALLNIFVKKAETDAGI
tara:strand:- start:892 stop:1143 length:252 start_codon:yes stop_codon:yes gene_type:complete